MSALCPIPRIEVTRLATLKRSLELAEACLDVLPAFRLFWNKQYVIAIFSDVYLVLLKAKLLRQPHRLAIALSKNFGCFHDYAPMFVCTAKYTRTLCFAPRTPNSSRDWLQFQFAFKMALKNNPTKPIENHIASNTCPATARTSFLRPCPGKGFSSTSTKPIRSNSSISRFTALRSR